jgi:hypothetical protein
MPKDVQINNEELEKFLQGDVGEFLQSTQTIDNTIKEIEIARQNGLPTPEGISEKIESFLEQGSSVLETMTIYCNNMPDSESVNSLASLINALSGSINKIANLWKVDQQHRNRVELEQQRHENRMEEIKLKERLKSNRDCKDVMGNNAETMTEISTADIVEQLMNAKKSK